MHTTSWNLDWGKDRKLLTKLALVIGLGALLLALLPRAAAAQVHATTAEYRRMNSADGVSATEVRYRPYYRRYAAPYYRSHAPRVYDYRPSYGYRTYARPYARPYVQPYYSGRPYSNYGYRTAPYRSGYYGTIEPGIGFGIYGW